jgi:signal transduction histidine kinase
MSDKLKLLYIDDERDNLLGFKASFRLQYQIFVAVNTEEATAILQQNPDIRVVFCDQRMPGKTGVAYFEEIKVQFPLPIRILITAFTDIDVVIKAINGGNIFRYIRKPWIEVDIISAIEEANKFYLANSMLHIKNKELQEAYKELDKFAYNVSHDLRSPLSSILAAVDSMIQMSDLAEIREMLTLIENSIFKQEDYIAGMHDYYKSQQGTLKIDEIDFNLLAEELKALFHIYVNTNKINFKIEVRQNTLYYSDEHLIKMILNNLITNAIKYQKKEFEDKRISVNMQVDDLEAVITISDTGIGIPESHYEEIFNLFSKVNNHGTGSGIGLYNVKNALNKLGGHMEVHSVVGEGTDFKLTIPNKK